MISLEHVILKYAYFSKEVFPSLDEFALRHPTYVLSNADRFEDVKLEAYLLSLVKNDTMDIRKLEIENWDKPSLFYELFKKQKMLKHLEVGKAWIRIPGGKMDLPKLRDGGFYPFYFSLPLFFGALFA